MLKKVKINSSFGLLIIGSPKDDIIFDNEHSNVFDLKDGNDKIYFSAGEDRVFGGRGSDTFFITDSTKNLTIHDFEISNYEEKISFRNLTKVLNFKDLKIRQSGFNAVVELDTENNNLSTFIIILANTTAENLNDNNFDFRVLSQPTSHPTLLSSQSNKPSIFSSTNFTSVNITQGGNFTGTNKDEKFLINVSRDIIISGGGGSNMFTIFPYNKITITITDFVPHKDSINLEKFSIYNFKEINITKGSIIIHLQKDQRIILLKLNPVDVTEDNFILTKEYPTEIPTPDLITSPPTKNNIEKDDDYKVDPPIITYVFSIIGGILGTSALAFIVERLLKKSNQGPNSRQVYIDENNENSFDNNDEKEKYSQCKSNDIFYPRNDQALVYGNDYISDIENQLPIVSLHSDPGDMIVSFYNEGYLENQSDCNSSLHNNTFFSANNHLSNVLGSDIDIESVSEENEKETSNNHKKHPVGISLADEEIEIIDYSESKIKFDFYDNNKLLKTSWVGPNDAILVYDHNDNKQVDLAKEIVLTEWSIEAKTDFEALLCNFDTNQDKIFNKEDQEFYKFYLWQDNNQDGVSQDGELTGLEEAGILAIDFNTQEEIEGDLRELGALNTADVLWEDGRVTYAYDLVFTHDFPSAPDIEKAVNISANVCATEYKARIAMDAELQGVKEAYIDPAFKPDLNTFSDVANTCYQSATDVSTYIVEEIELIMDYIGAVNLREDA